MTIFDPTQILAMFGQGGAPPSGMPAAAGPTGPGTPVPPTAGGAAAGTPPGTQTTTPAPTMADLYTAMAQMGQMTSQAGAGKGMNAPSPSVTGRAELSRSLYPVGQMGVRPPGGLDIGQSLQPMRRD